MHFSKGLIVPAGVNLSVKINLLADEHHFRKESFYLVTNIKLYKYRYRKQIT